MAGRSSWINAEKAPSAHLQKPNSKQPCRGHQGHESESGVGERYMKTEKSFILLTTQWLNISFLSTITIKYLIS